MHAWISKLLKLRSKEKDQTDYPLLPLHFFRVDEGVAYLPAAQHRQAGFLDAPPLESRGRVEGVGLYPVDAAGADEKSRHPLLLLMFICYFGIGCGVG